MRRILLACAVVVPVLLAGCTPTPQPAPNTPAPTIVAPTMQLMCTPEEGGPAAPCTQSEYDAMVERDKLYDEAKSVLRRYHSLSDPLLRSGQGASPELLDMTRGKGEELTRQALPVGVRWEGGEFRHEWVKRLPGKQKEDSTVALEACTDASTTRVVGSDSPGPGDIAIERYYFAGEPNDLKLVFIEYKVVEAC